MSEAPVIAIDGPSGAGKGTVAQRLAGELGFHLLDSGAVYRAAALHVLKQKANIDSEDSVVDALTSMQSSFVPHSEGVRVLLNGKDVTVQLRTEATAAAASTIAGMPKVRASLLSEQRSFRQAPGLVADGRDMGTVVFPDAELKVYLYASAEVRAKRRAKQLKDKGISSTMAGLLQEIVARDQRDSNREHSPLVAAKGSLTIDSSHLSIDAVVARILHALPQLTET